MTAKSDIIIVGCGVGGLYCALNLPSDKKITIITKAAVEDCDSYLAQGGICMLKNSTDYDSYYEDTMRAGHYENNPESVDIMIRSSRDVIHDLIGYGVRFEKDAQGQLKFTREGAHSTPRILFHEDITGKEITSHLLEAVQALPNVTIHEHVTMVDIIESRTPVPHCQGIIAMEPEGSALAAEYGSVKTSDGQLLFAMEAPEVVWACGGIGGLYEHSTNFPHLTGDALGIAIRHHIRLQNPDYIQIHPTTLYTRKPGRSFLISESVRGEGGILLNDQGKRFVNELLPRDVVSNAIFAEMKKTNAKHVWLSMENIPEEVIRTHFCHIYETCLEEGYDCTKEPIPVVPAQHYFMGGVDVDRYSQTTLAQLYAVGETSCNGVHGKNRLASNSLLESLVFAKRAALKIADEYDSTVISPAQAESINLNAYTDSGKLFNGFKDSIMNEIERMKKYHEQHHNENERRQSDPVSA